MTQLYLKLNESVWGSGDYTDSNTYALTGTIYSDPSFDTAFNLTGFTLRIKMYSQPDETTMIDESASIVSAGAGTWRFKPSQNILSTKGLYTVVIEASQSGTLVQTINRQELVIR